MNNLNITDAINDLPMIVQGGGALTANAMIAAGRMSTAMTIVEPLAGKDLSTVTPQQVLQASDPALKLERPPTPTSPQITIGTTGPGMGGGPNR